MTLHLHQALPACPDRFEQGMVAEPRDLYADQFSGAAALAIRAAKECIDRGSEVDLDTGLEIERQQFAALFATEDRAIGMQSFVENGPGKATFEGA